MARTRAARSRALPRVPRSVPSPAPVPTYVPFLATARYHVAPALRPTLRCARRWLRGRSRGLSPGAAQGGLGRFRSWRLRCPRRCLEQQGNALLKAGDCDSKLLTPRLECLHARHHHGVRGSNGLRRNARYGGEGRWQQPTDHGIPRRSEGKGRHIFQPHKAATFGTSVSAPMSVKVVVAGDELNGVNWYTSRFAFAICRATRKALGAKRASPDVDSPQSSRRAGPSSNRSRISPDSRSSGTVAARVSLEK